MSAGRDRPKGTVAYRSWVVEYDRPGGMGWPTLVKTGHEQLRRKDSRITVRKIAVTVVQYDGGEVTVSGVTVSGLWTGTNLGVTRERIAWPVPAAGKSFTIYAPDWVQEFVAWAVHDAEMEVQGWAKVPE